MTKKLVLLLCMGTLALALFGCSKNPVGPQVVVVKRAVPAGDQVVVVKRSVPKAQVVVVKR